ncbi:MAG: hypothetical protein K6E34_04525 [Lachnospiraceae bacterium]|nr:hypothetical protein [Lachnospiraceae bacterium]
MTKEELSPEKRREFDAIVDTMMAEIEEQSKEVEHKTGQLDGPGTQVYIRITRKYQPKLVAILNGE